MGGDQAFASQSRQCLGTDAEEAGCLLWIDVRLRNRYRC